MHPTKCGTLCAVQPSNSLSVTSFASTNTIDQEVQYNIASETGDFLEAFDALSQRDIPIKNYV